MRLRKLGGGDVLYSTVWDRDRLLLRGQVEVPLVRERKEGGIYVKSLLPGVAFIQSHPEPGHGQTLALGADSREFSCS